jgi:hypothetical protein
MIAGSAEMTAAANDRRAWFFMGLIIRPWE